MNIFRKKKSDAHSTSDVKSTSFLVDSVSDADSPSVLRSEFFPIYESSFRFHSFLHCNLVRVHTWYGSILFHTKTKFVMRLFYFPIHNLSLFTYTMCDFEFDGSISIKIIEIKKSEFCNDFSLYFYTTSISLFCLLVLDFLTSQLYFV